MKLLFFVLLFFVTSFGYSQNRIKEIQFISVKSKYEIKNGFSYGIKNNSISIFEYYVGMQAFFNSSWHDAIIDVDPKAPEMGVNIRTIKPKKVNLESYPSSNYFSDTSREGDKVDIKFYRFIISYKKHQQKNFKNMYSKAFVVR